MADLEVACCTPDALPACCEPDEKAACCGTGEKCRCRPPQEPERVGIGRPGDPPEAARR